MKKIVSLILIMLLAMSLFVACGSDPLITDGDNTNPTAEATPTPSPTPEPLYPEPLTGLEKDSSYPNDKSPVAVMVNNIKSSSGNDAFPQWGIGEADLIYEMVTEGGITRLMAVFSDYANMPSVGPVRSARDQHVQMMLPYDALYVHEGASIFAKRMLGEGTGVDAYDPEDFSMYDHRDRDLYLGSDFLKTGNIVKWDQALRNSGRSQEMCAYTSGELVSAAVENGADDFGEPEPIFNFVSYKEPERTPQGGSADSIFVQYSSYYYAGFDYNTAEGVYYKTNTKGDLHIDKTTGEQLSFENVFVLFTNIVPYSSFGHDAGQLSHVDLSQGGYGYYFTNGAYEKVRWIKGLPHEPLRIVDLEGNEIDVAVNPGKSYIGITDLSTMIDHCEINGLSFNEDLHPAS